MKKKQNMTFGFAEILFCAISAVVLIAVQTVLCSITSINPVLSGIFICAVFIASVCAFAVIRKNSAASRSSAPLRHLPGGQRHRYLVQQSRSGAFRQAARAVFRYIRDPAGF